MCTFCTSLASGVEVERLIGCARNRQSTNQPTQQQGRPENINLLPPIFSRVTLHAELRQKDYQSKTDAEGPASPDDRLGSGTAEDDTPVGISDDDLQMMFLSEEPFGML